jgi:hypothetical protein
MSSIAATWSPAPIAYNISVAVGDKLTIFVGRAPSVTSPLAAATVTG